MGNETARSVFPRRAARASVTCPSCHSNSRSRWSHKCTQCSQSPIKSSSRAGLWPLLSPECRITPQTPSCRLTVWLTITLLHFQPLTQQALPGDMKKLLCLYTGSQTLGCGSSTRGPVTATTWWTVNLKASEGQPPYGRVGHFLIWLAPVSSLKRFSLLIWKPYL